jgi:small subunit ribosomal protein S16
MALAIRLSRGGRKNRPHYSIVVADKRYARDGRFIEKLGTYNPLLKKDDANRVSFNEERIKYWLSQGAQPSDRIAIFLGKAGVTPMPAQKNNPQKAQQSEKTKLRIAEKAEKVKAQAEAAEAAKAEAEAAKAAAAAAPAEEAPAEAPAEAEAAPAEEAKAE